MKKELTDKTEMSENIRFIKLKEMNKKLCLFQLRNYDIAFSVFKNIFINKWLNVKKCAKIKND